MSDVGCLVWAGFHGTTVPAELRAQIAGGEVGAVVLFARNIPRDGELADLRALRALNDELHAAAPEGQPLLIAVDQEGGRVQRVKQPATVWPAMAALAAHPPERAEAVGRALGAELSALGFDADFAPVLDVHTNPANPIIGDRAFGPDAAGVADRALAFAAGLAAAGVLGCGKHFPGHGDTSTDSHLELPRVDHDLARLRAVELAPFSRAGALPMIMTAHVVFAAVDPDRPATLSPAVVQGVLRDELGYRGVVVSDDLEMRAIADNYGYGDAAVQAVLAGCDALLVCSDADAQAQVRDALAAEAARSPAVRARVAAAAAAVRALAQRAPIARPELDVVGCALHRRLAAELV